MQYECNRRAFIRHAALGVSCLTACGQRTGAAPSTTERPNLLFILTDQWRAQATAYAGNSDVRTPHLDRLASEGVNYSNAVSNCPVCCPYRASLITGRYPLTHGVFLNDLQLNTEAVSIAQVYRQAGYQTGYIGKWHLDGNGRSAYIPPARRQGFAYWKALECTHNYKHSEYYAGNDTTKRVWPGYDAFAQTDDALRYLSKRAEDREPFALFVSYGSPHAPYRTGPKELISEYDTKKLTLRRNIPAADLNKAQNTTAGYYAHITALDTCVGRLMTALKQGAQDKNTIVVFTSDHGDMLHSRGMLKKQRPWDESIRVPFLLRLPGTQATEARTIEAPISTPDIMPTLLALSGLPIPVTCEGQDLSGEVLSRAAVPADRGALILCPSPFGQWARRFGGREYRGVRTKRYTYARDLSGPWLLYDNQQDPFQQNNLIADPTFKDQQQRLESQLQTLLKQTGDRFLSGPALVRRCGYRVDHNETVAYNNPASFGQVSVLCRDQS